MNVAPFLYKFLCHPDNKRMTLYKAAKIKQRQIATNSVQTPYTFTYIFIEIALHASTGLLLLTMYIFMFII